MARRTFLIVAAGASTALVAGCSSAGSTASVSADDQVRAQVADAERALIAQYDQAIAAFPELGPSLGALVEQHRAHLASMGGALASAPADQVASSPPAAVAPATPSQALAARADAERAAAQQRREACLAATEPDLVRTLAFIAASESAHVPALAEVDA